MSLVLKIAYIVTSRGYRVLYTAEPYLDFFCLCALADSEGEAGMERVSV